jgi:hypothetical protein
MATNKKKKYLLITIDESNGGYEYTQKLLRIVPATANFNKVAEDTAKDWYGKDNLSHSENGTHEFFGGEIAVRARGITEITKAEFEILNKYI